MKTADKYEVCSICLSAIANGDFTPIDYSYNGADADAKEKAVREGMEELTEDGGYLTVGDGKKTNDHSVYPCQCCGSKLHGERYEAIVIRETTPREESTILLDSARGQYIPRDFCKLFNSEMLRQFGSATIQELSDPENELYWQVWEEVLNNFEIEGDDDTESLVLIQDEDLWLVPKNAAEHWEYI